MVQDNSEEYMPGVSFPDNHTRVPKEKKFLVYLFCILGYPKRNSWRICSVNTHTGIPQALPAEAIQ
jgi:hypothetical protein